MATDFEVQCLVPGVVSRVGRSRAWWIVWTAVSVHVGAVEACPPDTLTAIRKAGGSCNLSRTQNKMRSRAHCAHKVRNFGCCCCCCGWCCCADEQNESCTPGIAMQTGVPAKQARWRSWTRTLAAHSLPGENASAAQHSLLGNSLDQDTKARKSGFTTEFCLQMACWHPVSKIHSLCAFCNFILTSSSMITRGGSALY